MAFWVTAAAVAVAGIGNAINAANEAVQRQRDVNNAAERAKRVAEQAIAEQQKKLEADAKQREEEEKKQIEENAAYRQLGLQMQQNAADSDFRRERQRLGLIQELQTACRGGHLDEVPQMLLELSNDALATEGPQLLGLAPNEEVLNRISDMLEREQEARVPLVEKIAAACREDRLEEVPDLLHYLEESEFSNLLQLIPSDQTQRIEEMLGIERERREGVIVQLRELCRAGRFEEVPPLLQLLPDFELCTATFLHNIPLPESVIPLREDRDRMDVMIRQERERRYEGRLILHPRITEPRYNPGCSIQ